MKKPPAKPASDDGDLFEKLFSNVTPLPAHGRVIHATPRRKPIPEQRLRDERAALAASLSDHITWDIGLETGEELVYLRNGLSPQTLKYVAELQELSMELVWDMVEDDIFKSSDKKTMEAHWQEVQKFAERQKKINLLIQEQIAFVRTLKV